MIENESRENCDPYPDSSAERLGVNSCTIYLEPARYNQCLKGLASFNQRTDTSHVKNSYYIARSTEESTARVSVEHRNDVASSNNSK